MPVLTAAVSALLISVSCPALTQECNGGRACGQPQAPMLQEEPAQQEERQHGEAATPEMKRPEMRAETPQVERQESENESELEQFLAQLPDRPLADRERDVEQLLAQLPDRPLADRQRELEQFLTQLPERKPAEAQQPTKGRPARERLARLTTRQPADEQPAGTDEPRPPEAMKAEAEQDPPAPAGTDMPRDPKWKALEEPGLGTTLDLPRAMFSIPGGDAGANEGAGRRYRTPDGRAKVAVWTQPNIRRDTPAGYLRRTFVIARATVDYERFTPDFAVVSGAYGGRIFYIRCNLSRWGSLHCFDLAYPAREKKAWDAVVTRMSRSLRPHEYE
jgi:hypothetical protein